MPVHIPTGTRLDVSYQIHEAPTPVSEKLAVLMHGLCHSREMSKQLIKEQNALGIPVASIDIQSENAQKRNHIGLSDYVFAFKSAMARILTDTSREIGSVAGHSMGGLIVQEAMQKYPCLRRPAAFLAPIPLSGAWRAVPRTAMHNPRAIPKLFKSTDVSTLMRTPEEVRTLFFDEQTPEEIVQQTTQQIRHTSYRAYLELLGRPVLRPRIKETDLKSMLLYSHTDFLFHPGEYKSTRKKYVNLEEYAIPGGHDFFIQNADATAQLMADFHLKYADT